MDLFDASKKAEEIFLTDQEAFASIMLVAVAADGQITPEERDGYVNALINLSMFEGWDADMFNATTASLADMIQQHGMQKLVRIAAEALPEEMRLTAFARACDLVCADGIIEANEKKLINDLFPLLGIKPETAQTILKVIVILNRRK